MAEPNYELLPFHLRTGMQMWVERGIKPGSFLRAVITNDLCQAALRADALSFASLGNIARWCVHNLPEGSFGRSQVLEQWPLYIGAKTRQESRDA